MTKRKKEVVAPGLELEILTPEKARTVAETISQTPIGNQVFKALMSRQRTRDVTDLRIFYHRARNEKQIDYELPYKDFLSVFKQLADSGFGTLADAQGNKHEKFHWRINLIDVAKDVMGVDTAPDGVTYNFSIKISKDTIAELPTSLKKASATLLEIVREIEKIQAAPQTKSSQKPEKSQVDVEAVLAQLGTLLRKQ